MGILLTIQLTLLILSLRNISCFAGLCNISGFSHHCGRRAQIGKEALVQTIGSEEEFTMEKEAERLSEEAQSVRSFTELDHSSEGFLEPISRVQPVDGVT